MINHASLQRLGAILLPSVISLTALAHAGSAGRLQPGDLVGICGDSITEQKLYSLYMADYLLMCQPEPKLSAIQFGWSGETAPGFLARMKNDALVFKPTVATTCYGMNDGGYTATTPERLAAYRKAMTGIVDALKAGGVRFIVVGTPGAVDTYFFKNRSVGPDVYNQTLADFGQAAKEVADRAGVGFADVHGAMIEAMAKAKAQNGADFPVAGGDGVHPHPDGHLIMAYAFLKALGCDGNIGTITVDLKSNRAEATGGTKVLSVANGTVTLESTRYPFCFPGANDKDPISTRSILPFLPFNQDLNRYMLVVRNVPSDSLKVTWGSQSRTFPAADLAKGVNLAAEFLDNPFSVPFMAVQQKLAAQQAFETLGSKWLLHSLLSWRDLPEANDVMGPVIPRLTSTILTKWQGLRNASAAALMPVKHSIKIEPAG
ncbi:MAG: SGNH/GDSL hydrolase family protein [Terrimicrobiaceae bacterium]|nr:SGNH/GDSL hydrolase family protein [Terrimicrobiaceae bacterium]